MRRSRALMAMLVTGLSLLLAGCAPTVTLHPAPEATSARCASLVAGLRQTSLAGLDYRVTDAQGTLAWGSPLQVTLVCGETAVPASSKCVTVSGVSWAQTTLQSESGLVDRYDTFQRIPDIAVFMDRLTVSPQDVLAGISDVVQTAAPTTNPGC